MCLINNNLCVLSLFAQFACLIIGLAMLVLMPYLQYTPKAALGAIVIQGCIKLVNFREGRSLFRTAKRDCITFWIVVGVTLLLGVQAALLARPLLSCSSRPLLILSPVIPPLLLL